MNPEFEDDESLPARPRSLPPLDASLVRSTLHDVNNLLTAITLDTELLASGSPDACALTRDIATAAHRAATLCQRLLVGELTQPPQAAELSEVVEEILRLTARLPPVVLDLAAPPPADVDFLRLRQALANLVSNAATAMQGRPGSLRIASAAVELTASALDVLGNTLSPGRFWTISVADQGRGLDARQIRQIFQPGYSTRREAMVSGFGLLAVSEAALWHGGGVFVESAPGQGSRFTLWLPMS